jgi:hypothetical protein
MSSSLIESAWRFWNESERNKRTMARREAMSVRRLANVLERDSGAPSGRCISVADYDVYARQPPPQRAPVFSAAKSFGSAPADFSHPLRAAQRSQHKKDPLCRFDRNGSRIKPQLSRPGLVGNRSRNGPNSLGFCPSQKALRVDVDRNLNPAARLGRRDQHGAQETLQVG